MLFSTLKGRNSQLVEQATRKVTFPLNFLMRGCDYKTSCYKVTV